MQNKRSGRDKQSRLDPKVSWRLAWLIVGIGFLFTPAGFLLSLIIGAGTVSIIEFILSKTKYVQPNSDVTKRTAAILLFLLIVVMPLAKVGDIRNDKMAYLNSIVAVDATPQNLAGSYMNVNVNASVLNVFQTIDPVETLKHSSFEFTGMTFNSDGTFERAGLSNARGEFSLTGTYELSGDQLKLVYGDTTENYYVEIKEGYFFDDNDKVMFLNLYADESQYVLVYSGMGSGSDITDQVEGLIN